MPTWAISGIQPADLAVDISKRLRDTMSQKSNDENVPEAAGILTDQDLYELFDTFSASSATASDGPYTPSYSSEATMTGGGSNSIISQMLDPAVPGPNETFLIRHRESFRTITLIDGQLRLCDDLTLQGGFHWRCEEKDGWLGFRNCVSGTYMGYDDKKKFIARVTHHRDHEYFCVRPHARRGGYELLTRHGQKLWRMGVADDGKTLVEITQGEGATWDFHRIPERVPKLA
jgi:hypothetical protein